MSTISVNFDVRDSARKQMSKLCQFHSDNYCKFEKALTNLNYKNYLKTFDVAKGKAFGYYMTTSTYLEVILRIVNKSSLLDLGCGAGVLLSTLKKAGIKTKGYDIDDTLINYAKDQGLNCHKRDILKVKAKHLKGYKYLYAWEPFETPDLAEKFVANLVKEAKGKTLIYRGHGIIGNALHKRKDTLKIDHRQGYGITIIKF